MFNVNLQGGTIYQIMPDKFFRGKLEKKLESIEGKVIHEIWSEEVIWKPDEKGIIKNNDFFGGNLRGIIEKLPYIADLGVTFIYLNPIFKAYSNHRYDTGNYLEIDPFLGTSEDFKTLCIQAKEYGIGIILDGVFAHTGSDSLYFNRENNYNELGAYNSENSKYQNWYKFRKYPNIYDSWWGFTTLPQTNQDCKEYRDFICNEVIPKWMNLGAAGFRLDVVDELSNSFIEEICFSIHKRNGFVIGEVWENAATKHAYGTAKNYFDGKKLDSVMNYPWKSGIIDYIRYGTEFLKKQIEDIVNTYPKDILNNVMNILSTHDIERAITAISMPHLEGKDRQYQYDNHNIPKEIYKTSIRKLKLATILQFFLPGVPSIYYGDEIGMSGYKDPFNRYPFNWNNIDYELLDFFKKIGRIRKETTFLSKANLEIIHYDFNYITFKRKYLDKEILICVNRSEYIIYEHLLVNSKILYTNSTSEKSTNIDPLSFVIFILN